MSTLEIAVGVYCAYLVGSFSSAIVICKLMGLPDPRTQGSRNPGATNVLRLGGKKAAFLTLLGDALKGFLPVLIAKLMNFPTEGVALVAFAAFLGHLFPIFFRFAGGKGVATALGALFALCWPAGIAWGLVWLVSAWAFRYSSLAALTASAFAPSFVWYFTHQNAYLLVMSMIAIALFITHRNNIRRLLAGTESKLGKK